MTAEYVDPWAVDYPQRIALATGLLGTHRCAFPSCARVIAETVAILTDDTPTQIGHGYGRRRENSECAPEAAPTAAGTTCTTPQSHHRPEGGPLPMILDHPVHVHAECHQRHAEDADTIRRLRTALQSAVRTRDTLAARAIHWFVDPDQTGICAACGLPRTNARHTAQAVTT